MKKSSRDQQPCDKHDFSLKPRTQYLIHPQNYNVSFCQSHHQKHPKKNKSTSQSFCSNLPTFNVDANHATPSFILHSEKNYYQARGDKLRQEHDIKFVDYCQEKSLLNVPKPRSKNNFCNVCHTNYDDYLEHINSVMHHKKINQSVFNRYLLELTQKYEQPLSGSKPKTLDQDRTTTNINLQDDDEVQIISNPHKKIKINQTLSLKDLQAQNIPLNSQLKSNPVYSTPTFTQYIFSNNLQTMYNQQINQFNMNYNMNFYMSSLGLFAGSFRSINYQSYNHPYLQYPFFGFQGTLPIKPKEVCIVIDE